METLEVLVSVNGDNEVLHILDGFYINKTNPDPLIITVSTVSAVLILIVSILVIKVIMKKPKTFINMMVIADCALSVAHIPVLLQIPL